MNTEYQNPLTLLDAEAIPEDSKPLLEVVRKKFGFVPNLITSLARSPATLEAYLTLADLAAKTSFTPAEQHAGALIISQKNGCSYCLAAHGTIGKSVGLDNETVVALQTGAALPTERLKALRTLLLSILETKGFPTPSAIKSFKAAGFTDKHLSESVILVTWKTLSNYINHLHDTSIDAEFAPNSAPVACSTGANACACS